MSWTEEQLREHVARKAALLPAEEEPESALHDQIIAACRENGWLYFHGAMHHRTSRSIGEPDFTLLLPGSRVLFIECKTTSGKPSPAQLAVIAHAAKLGTTIHIVRSLAAFHALINGPC